MDLVEGDVGEGRVAVGRGDFDIPALVVINGNGGVEAWQGVNLVRERVKAVAGRRVSRHGLLEPKHQLNHGTGGQWRIHRYPER